MTYALVMTVGFIIGAVGATAILEARRMRRHFDRLVRKVQQERQHAA